MNKTLSEHSVFTVNLDGDGVCTDCPEGSSDNWIKAVGLSDVKSALDWFIEEMTFNTEVKGLNSKQVDYIIKKAKQAFPIISKK